jgi:acetyl-CoA carboxylase biotin carboxyl carrier protein
MRAQDMAGIAAAMAAAGVARLELTGPDFRLTLGLDARLEPQAVETGAEVSGAEVETAPPGALGVASPGVGVFLRVHPLHDRPLAAAGDAVAAGQTVAVLRVGALLLPVVAPVAGIVIAAAAPEGTLVGYGDRLFDLLPQD